MAHRRADHDRTAGRGMHTGRGPSNRSKGASKRASKSHPIASRSGGADGKQIVGPILAAIAIDLLDLATFGPFGLYSGMIVGVAAGWWLAPSFGFGRHRRWVAAVATGFYCTLPLTGLVPLATLACLLLRWPQPGRPPVDADEKADLQDVIDAEYEIVPDDHGPEPTGAVNDRLG